MEENTRTRKDLSHSSTEIISIVKVAIFYHKQSTNSV